MHLIPARFAASIPYGESSITKHSSGREDNFLAAKRKMQGSGLDEQLSSSIVYILSSNSLVKPSLLSIIVSKL